jgi:putative transposase
MLSGEFHAGNLPDGFNHRIPIGQVEMVRVRLFWNDAGEVRGSCRVGIAHHGVGDLSNYRRALATGATYFFTVVTFKRRPFLIEPRCLKALREAIIEVREEMPFGIDAWVLLPDHFHCIWSLPDGDFDYSGRMGRIKAAFSKQRRFLQSENISSSMHKHRESGLWQRRFWEHIIRDELDYEQHMNYIHYNPVKHGYVAAVRDWPHSTFHRYVRQGVYSFEWGGGFNCPQASDFGE